MEFDWVGIFGISVGIIGLAYAVYENRSKANLSHHIRTQNWLLYTKTINAHGSVQLALEKYKESNPESINIEVIEWLSKADAFAQDIFTETIKQIRFSEPSFSPEDIDRWIKEGRISQENVKFFRLLSPANNKIKRTHDS